ncbi:MAG: RodZ domain-containing protein [Terriglobia bacterium]
MAEEGRVAVFGESLRREREMRGISIEEISETTKISVRFLQALERDEFDKLPGGIFIRSFIRSYASYLGLDCEQVLAEFQIVAPARGDEDFSRLGVTATSPRKRFRAPILPWVIAVLLLAGGYAIFRYSHQSGEAALGDSGSLQISRSAPTGAAPSKTRGATPPVGPRASPSLEPANSNTVPEAPQGSLPDTVPSVTPAASGPPKESSAPAAKTGAAGSLSLHLLATEQSWVDVKADDKTLVERVLAPNDVLNLSAKNSFDVITGNAEGIVLTLDGVTLKPLGRRGEVKAVHLTAEDAGNSAP